MFRQVLKLRLARRAYKDGRFDEALKLVEEPDVCEHLKAQKLKRSCLKALQKRADRRERKGDLTLAVADLHEIRDHDPEDRMVAKERELQDKKDHRDEVRGRLRARYYRARLEVDRGNLSAAKDILEGIDVSRRSPEMKDLFDELLLRVKRARELLSDGRRKCRRDPAAAEELLLEASKQDPKAEGLNDAYRELAQCKVALVGRGQLSDGALSGFLLDWGFFKRRYLGFLSEADQRDIESSLVQQVAKRAKERIAAAQLAPARTLLDRQAEVLCHDDDLANLREGVRELDRASTEIETGNYGRVRELLDSAERLVGAKKFIRELRERTRRLEKTVLPALEEAERSFEDGDLETAKRAVLRGLTEAPEHRDCRLLLARLNTAEDERWSSLDRARQLTRDGRFGAAP